MDHGLNRSAACFIRMGFVVLSSVISAALWVADLYRTESHIDCLKGTPGEEAPWAQSGGMKNTDLHWSVSVNFWSGVLKISAWKLHKFGCECCHFAWYLRHHGYGLCVWQKCWLHRKLQMKIFGHFLLSGQLVSLLGVPFKCLISLWMMRLFWNCWPFRSQPLLLSPFRPLQKGSVCPTSWTQTWQAHPWVSALTFALVVCLSVTSTGPFRGPLWR